MTELTAAELDRLMPFDDEAPAMLPLEAVELRRRQALFLVFGATAASAMLGLSRAQAAEISATAATSGFLHGVASGDPLTDRVIIWTRFTPAALTDTPNVAWAVSEHPNMQTPIASGTIVTNAAIDFTVKVDVTGLQPGKRYYYRFTSGGFTSPTGRSFTLPAADSTDPQVLAIFSCSNFEKGYFNAYADAARRKDIKYVLHIGDYNYEYGQNRYTTPALAAGVAQEPRAGLLQPTTDTVTLDAYRQRKSLYRGDPDLQALHARCPWIVVWDDHESANDAWTGGAENHNATTQGSWAARKAAAVQAYYEWMPVREPADGNRIDPVSGNPAHLYRSFDFGKLLRVTMLDTRMAGRDQQLSISGFLNVYQGVGPMGPFPKDVVGTTTTPRSLMGAAQEAWFDTQMTSSTHTWQIIASQVLTHYQVTPDFQNLPVLTEAQKQIIINVIDAQFFKGAGAAFGALGKSGSPNPATADSWTGYPSARVRFLQSMAKAANPIIVSGDSHNFWTANLRLQNGATTQKVGVEFGGGGVTSPGYEEQFYQIASGKLASLFTLSSAANSPTDKLIYADMKHHGYMALYLTPTRAVARYVFLSTVYARDFITGGRQFEVKPGARETSVTG